MTQEEALRKAIEEFVQKLLPLLKEVKEVQTEKEGLLTKRALLELAYHEGMTLEAYKDSVGVWTWGIGVTNKSGHIVFPRYKDNPSSPKKVIDVFKWLVTNKYLPDVLEAFEVPLSEEQLAAALSFHYNTGAIKRASWVKSFNKGDFELARKQIMNWRSPPEIIPRREAERDLFFDGKWSGDGTTVLYSVRKPSYSPNWGSAKRIDISKEL